MNDYQAVYEDQFVRNLTRYSGLRQRIRRKVEQTPMIARNGSDGFLVD